MNPKDIIYTLCLIYYIFVALDPNSLTMKYKALQNHQKQSSIFYTCNSCSKWHQNPLGASKLTEKARAMLLVNIYGIRLSFGSDSCTDSALRKPHKSCSRSLLEGWLEKSRSRDRSNTGWWSRKTKMLRFEIS